MDHILIFFLPRGSPSFKWRTLIGSNPEAINQSVITSCHITRSTLCPLLPTCFSLTPDLHSLMSHPPSFHVPFLYLPSHSPFHSYPQFPLALPFPSHYHLLLLLSLCSLRLPFTLPPFPPIRSPALGPLPLPFPLIPM